jgi:hypothetical protein
MHADVHFRGRVSEGEHLRDCCSSEASFQIGIIRNLLQDSRAIGTVHSKGTTAL